MARRAFAAATAALVLLTVAGCGGDNSGSSAATTVAGGAATTGAGSATTAGGGAAGKPIVIGAAVAQSGGFELYDNEVIKGMQYQMDKINAAGGVGGRKFELVVADHKTDPAQVESAAKEVLSKGADVVVTTADYDFGAAAALAAQQAGKVSMGGAGAPQFGKSGLGALHFNVYQGTATEAAVMAQFAQEKGYKKPYLLSDTSIEYSKSVCDLFEQSWKQLGGSIAGKQTFLSSDPSIANQVSAVKSADADVVIMCSYPPGGSSAIRQVRTGGVNLPIIGGAAFDGTFWLQAIPDLSNFYYPTMVSSAGDDPNPDVNAFLAAVKPAGGAIYSLFGYEIIESVAKALAMNGGKADGTELAKALESFKDEKLLVGPTTYTADCHVPLGRPMAVLQIQGGKPKFIEYSTPKELADKTC
jgi:branched-chain amino acid transport system substrate-binding protein